ncbi:MAG: hypothetical protein M3Z82_02390 [Apilactobacillus sp.]|nr:hypothetical protein [Apilactobacillus sp.]
MTEISLNVLLLNDGSKSIVDSLKDNINKYREELNKNSYVFVLSVMINLILSQFPPFSGIVFSSLIIIFAIIPAAGWFQSFKLKNNNEFVDEIRSKNIDNDDRKIIFLRLINKDKIDMLSLFFSLIGFFGSIYGIFDKITTQYDTFTLFWILFVTIIIINFALYRINCGRIKEFKNNVNLTDYSLK